MMPEVIFRPLDEIPSDWNQDNDWWFAEIYKPNFGWLLPIASATIQISNGRVDVDSLHTNYDHRREGWATRLMEAIIEKWPRCVWIVTYEGELLTAKLIERGLACQLYRSTNCGGQYSGVPIQFREGSLLIQDAFAAVRESSTGGYFDLLNDFGTWIPADTHDVYDEFRRRGACPMLDHIHISFKHWVQDVLRSKDTIEALAEQYHINIGTKV